MGLLHTAAWSLIVIMVMIMCDYECDRLAEGCCTYTVYMNDCDSDRLAVGCCTYTIGQVNDCGTDC